MASLSLFVCFKLDLQNPNNHRTQVQFLQQLLLERNHSGPAFVIRPTAVLFFQSALIWRQNLVFHLSLQLTAMVRRLQETVSSLEDQVTAHTRFISHVMDELITLSDYSGILLHFSTVVWALFTTTRLHFKQLRNLLNSSVYDLLFTYHINSSELVI